MCGSLGKIKAFFFLCFDGANTFNTRGNTSISTGIDGPGSPSILVAKSSILDKSSMDALFTVNVVV